MKPFSVSSPLQNLFQFFSFCKFVDQLVQIPDIPHQRIFYTLQFHSADGAPDKKAVRNTLLLHI